MEYRKDSLHATSLLVPPRNIYTTHSYDVQADDINVQRCNQFVEFFDAPQFGEWPGVLMPLPAGSPRSSTFPVAETWYQHTSQQAPYYDAEDCCIYTETWRVPHSSAAIVTSLGTMSLLLRDRVRVDMTIDRAVRVINFKKDIVLSLSSSGSAASLLHPSGHIYQYGSCVEILACDVHGNNKYAKMWHKGVSFTSEQSALIYLVDAAGTRTASDCFSDMSQDFSLSVFYNDSHHGSSYIQEANSILQAAEYWITDGGIENWIVNNVRISQTADGFVRICRSSNKYKAHTSPTNGKTSLTTPFLHCTASVGQTSHLFVRRGERCMHYDGSNFIVRNARHSAGFDENNKLKVY